MWPGACAADSSWLSSFRPQQLSCCTFGGETIRRILGQRRSPFHMHFLTTCSGVQQPLGHAPESTIAHVQAHVRAQSITTSAGVIVCLHGGAKRREGTVQAQWDRVLKSGLSHRPVGKVICIKHADDGLLGA